MESSTEPPRHLAMGHVLLTGATGFLGQALLERLLSGYPTTRVTLLVRAKGSWSGSDRLATLLRRPVFNPWRKALGAEAAAAAVAERVRVVEADLGSDRVDLPDDLTAVIHGASTVSFDPPIDLAFRTNVQGVIDLYSAVRHLASRPHVVHVSTAYVAGARKGTQPERSLDHDADWQVELAAAVAARASVEADSRRPTVLRRLLAEARAEHGKSGPSSTATAAEAARKEWVDKQLIEYGRLRGQSLGWPDVYTFTKALGERITEEFLSDELPLSVVRPTIVESALRHPYPGWIDGFKMTDPLIIAFGQGMLSEFPGLPDGVLDLIPVDIVVNAILAVAAEQPPVGKPAYYHVGSGARNPLTIRGIYDHLREYFTHHPMPGRGRGEIKVPVWDFPGQRRVGRMLRRGERALGAAQQVLLAAPTSNRTRRWQDELIRQRDRLDSLRRYSEIYDPYMQAEVIFTDDRLLALHRALPAGRVSEHGFDAAGIDWQHYVQRVHAPAITSTTRKATVGRRTRAGGLPALKATPNGAAVAVFDMEGTLVGANVVETYLLARLCDLPPSRWPGEVADLLRKLPRYLAAERRDRGEFLRTFMRRYAGADEAGLHRIIRDQLGDAILRRSYPQAIRQVRKHRAVGHRTVLITGTIDVLVQPLAALFDEVVASRLHLRDGRYSGFLDTPPLVGEARAEWLRRYAEKADLDLSASYAYGDSYSDRPLLEAVGNPVAVNPDPHLYRHARSKRWEVVQWTSHALASDDTIVETV
ncbi:MAG TPA: HAD-IB family hydrolase [Pilimelia sp.]|nr:HAD-IB family hydrolase [Pilimelia sp.]